MKTRAGRYDLLLVYRVDRLTRAVIFTSVA
jgi:hypothetical protein